MKKFPLPVAILIAFIYIFDQKAGVLGRVAEPIVEDIKNELSIGYCHPKPRRGADECGEFFQGTPPCKRSHCTYANSRHGLRLCSFWQLNGTDCRDDEVTKLTTPKPKCDPVELGSHCSNACSEYWKDNWSKNYIFTGGVAFVCTNAKKSVCGCAQIATSKYIEVEEVRIKRDAMHLHISTSNVASGPEED